MKPQPAIFEEYEIRHKLKERLGKEGSESVTNCHRLKLPAADGKNYLTDVAAAEWSHWALSGWMAAQFTTTNPA